MEEDEEKFEDIEADIRWIENHVPPDDIYIFANLWLEATQHFFYLWAQGKDLEQEAKKDHKTLSYMSSLSNFFRYKALGNKKAISLKFKNYNKQ